MIEFYVTQIRLGEMIPSEVPLKYRNAVEEALKK